jgi:hypothetical protein
MTARTTRCHPGVPVSPHEPSRGRDTQDGRPSRARGRPRLGLRVRVWVNEHELNAALARGTDPRASDELELRAERLARPEQRLRLADALEELLELAGGHEVLANSEALSAATSPHLQLAEIRTCRSSLIRLVNRLRDKRPADVQGLAQVRCLLSDDRSPLYRREASSSLDDAVAAAIGGLDRSPVDGAPAEEAIAPAAVRGPMASGTSAHRPSRSRGRERAAASAGAASARGRWSTPSRHR